MGAKQIQPRTDCATARPVVPLEAAPQFSESLSSRKLRPQPLRGDGAVAHIRQMMQTTETTPNATPQINLSGEWIGHYRGHFDQVIKITQLGDEVLAVKITGDEHVPGGAPVSFRASWRSSAPSGSFSPGRTAAKSSFARTTEVICDLRFSICDWLVTKNRQSQIENRKFSSRAG